MKLSGQSRYRDYNHECQRCHNINIVKVDLAALSDVHFGGKNKQIQASSRPPKTYPYTCPHCGQVNQLLLS